MRRGFMLAHGWRIENPTDEDLGEDFVKKIEKLGRDANPATRPASCRPPLPWR